MDCVNHIGVSATAYCQSCGKALCAGCVRNAAGGQLLCEPCWMTWQSYQQPFVAPPASGPNPSVAAVLGLIPGVGAMYNGQFFKGFIHVIVFAVLISITSSVNGIFGIFIGAWVLYQSFEAFHTAKALRDGQPLPDPLGLNEVGNWLNLGTKLRYPGQPGAGPDQPAPGPANQGPVAGGYPPVLARQSAHRRDAWFHSYILTILQRAIRRLMDRAPTRLRIRRLPVAMSTRPYRRFHLYHLNIGIPCSGGARSRLAPLC